MFGVTHRKPEFLYVKYNRAGRKCFYDRRTDKIVAKSEIDPKIVDQIQTQSDAVSVGDLINEKNGYLLEIERLQEKIRHLDEKISEFPNIDPEQAQRAVEEEKEKLRMAQEKEEADRAEAMRRFMEQMEAKEAERKKRQAEENARKQRSQQDRSTKIERARDLLRQRNINTRKEWLEWLRKNHADKGGNHEECQNVISAGQEVHGW